MFRLILIRDSGNHIFGIDVDPAQGDIYWGEWKIVSERIGDVRDVGPWRTPRIGFWQNVWNKIGNYLPTWDDSQGCEKYWASSDFGANILEREPYLHPPLVLDSQMKKFILLSKSGAIVKGISDEVFMHYRYWTNSYGISRGEGQWQKEYLWCAAFISTGMVHGSQESGYNGGLLGIANGRMFHHKHWNAITGDLVNEKGPRFTFDVGRRWWIWESLQLTRKDCIGYT